MKQDELDRIIETLMKGKPYLQSNSKGSKRKSTIVLLEESKRIKYEHLIKKRELDKLKEETVAQRKQEAEDRRKRGRLLRPIEKENER
jgi:hypothetical protein